MGPISLDGYGLIPQPETQPEHPPHPAERPPPPLTERPPSPPVEHGKSKSRSEVPSSNEKDATSHNNHALPQSEDVSSTDVLKPLTRLRTKRSLEAKSTAPLPAAPKKKKSLNRPRAPLPFPLAEDGTVIPKSFSRDSSPNSVDEFFTAAVSAHSGSFRRHSRSRSSSLLPLSEISCIGCYDEAGRPGGHVVPSLPDRSHNEDTEGIQCDRCDRWSHMYCIRTQWGIPESYEGFWMCQLCAKLSDEEDVLWNDKT